MNKRQSGFTLVEIAIVLVIIGLLLGGILKGQELINSARVRNLADTTAGIQAAYYGFIDRYRQVPGDMLLLTAQNAINPAIAAGGNGDGQLGGLGALAGAVASAADWAEVSGLWVHLTQAGFLQGTFTGQGDATGAGGTAAGYTGNAGGPINVFNGTMLLGRGRDYTAQGNLAPANNNATHPVRLHLVLGNNVPVDIARELDVKVDDSTPDTGVLRLTGNAVVTYGPVSQSTSNNCIAVPGGGAPNIWNITQAAQNCNLAFIY